eukprot:scaffold124100_cov23-Tisochrysis_lutea.AAC.1
MELELDLKETDGSNRVSTESDLPITAAETDLAPDLLAHLLPSHPRDSERLNLDGDRRISTVRIETVSQLGIRNAPLRWR